MKYPFHICDVFTSQRFGGNQLAVLPEAEGLDEQQMQQIAREFNFSETTFVLPSDSEGIRCVRIFTPAREVPFAGHPNIGTAFTLARRGDLGEIGSGCTVTFSEKAGLVPVEIRPDGNGAIRCELTAPQALGLGDVLMPELAAAALSLEVADISMHVHPPRVAGVGLPFLIVELVSLEALQRARFNTVVLETLQDRSIPPDILLYTRDTTGDADYRARMFAPLDGVPEDPATGSANCALAALLAQSYAQRTADYSFRIVQGVEMGRPSLLEARVSKRNGEVFETKIGGDCVMIAEGILEVG